MRGRTANFTVCLCFPEADFVKKKDNNLKIKKFLVYLFLKLPEIDSDIFIFVQLKFVEYARVVVERSV